MMRSVPVIPEGVRPVRNLKGPTWHSGATVRCEVTPTAQAGALLRGESLGCQGASLLRSAGAFRPRRVRRALRGCRGPTQGFSRAPEADSRPGSRWAEGLSVCFLPFAERDPEDPPDRARGGRRRPPVRAPRPRGPGSFPGPPARERGGRGSRAGGGRVASEEAEAVASPAPTAPGSSPARPFTRRPRPTP